MVPRPPMPAPGRAPSWQRPQPPAPPALTGEVMPPSPPQQAFSLGQAQVRLTPTEPAWPQTVTLGPGGVPAGGAAARPQGPWQVEGPAAAPLLPRRTPEQRLQALHGHGHERHGSQTTLAEQEGRLRTGRAPDGRPSPTKQATRFDSPEAELDAVTRADAVMQQLRRGGLLPPNVITAPTPGGTRLPYIPRQSVFVTGFPGGYGSGLRASGKSTNMVMAPTGQLPNAEVRFEIDPLGRWHLVSQFPSGKPVTPIPP